MPNSRLVGGANRDFLPTDEEEALALAFRLTRSPQMMRRLRQLPLPSGVGWLIRLAAQCPATSAEAAERLGVRPAELHAIATLYLRVVLLTGQADAYRVLGVRPDAGVDEIRENKNWLLKWLHPDRNSDPDASALAARVNAAWRDLSRRPESVTAPAAEESGQIGLRRKVFRHIWIRRPIVTC